MSIGIEVEHVIARQRRETAAIALNTVSERLQGHVAMRQSGLAPQTKATEIVSDGATTRLSKLGDALDFILS